MKALDFLTGALLVVGEEFGETNALSRIVYGLVGLSAAYQATRLPMLASREGRDARTATA